MRRPGHNIYHRGGLDHFTGIDHDLEMTSTLFSDERFKPDGLKLYPTLVVSHTELEQWWKAGKYVPYTLEETVKLMVDIKKIIPGYVRIPRVMRDIPPRFILAGCKDLSLRSQVREVLKTEGVQCQCTRCREYGHRLRDRWQIGQPELHRLEYTASGGREIFLSYEDEKGTLFGLLRLRMRGSNGDIYPAMIREIHIFGSEVPIGAQDDKAAQHKGLGAALIREAERIAHEEYSANRIAVISGVGARDYFRTELGYQLDGHYMAKDL